MKFKMTKKSKFFLLASLIFFGVSVASSVLGFFAVGQLSFLLFGPLTGLGQLIYGLAGVIGTIVGLFVGALIALFINLKIGRKWMGEFGERESERKGERARLTCLSFIVFLVLLWCLIVVIARL